MNLQNGTDREWGRVERLMPCLRWQVADALYALGIERSVTIWLCDGDEDRMDLADGRHDWGKFQSLCLVRVWPEKWMSNEALLWMICHELRHVWQSVYGSYLGDGDPGLPHDQLPCEADANWWASDHTDFKGLEWWAGFLKDSGWEAKHGL